MIFNLKNNLFLIIIFSKIIIPDICLSANTIDSAARPLTIDNHKKKYSLGSHLEYLEDKNNKLTIDDVISGQEFQHGKDEVLNFGYTKSTYWLRFSIITPRDQIIEDKEWLLELGYPLIDYVDLYIPDLNDNYRIIESGDMRPFINREIKHYNFIFKIKIKSGQKQTFYLRLKSDSSIQIPATFMTPLNFIQNQQVNLLVYGLFFGILIIVVLYNFFLYLVINDKTYIYYVLFVISYILFQLSLHGFSVQYLWPDSIWWADKSIPVFIDILLVFSLFFSTNFLNTKKNVPIIHKIIMGFTITIIIAAILSFFLSYKISIRFSSTIVLILPFFIIFAAINSLIKKYRPALFYIIATSMLLIGAIVFALNKSGMFPRVFLTEYALQIGSVLMVVLLSFALGDKINFINKEKEKARDEALEAQEKYSLIFEGSKEIIFTLNENWRFITANRAIKSELNIDPDNINGMEFMNIIFDGYAGRNVAKKSVQKKLDYFTDTRQPINLKIQFISSLGTEPKEMHVRLEYLNIRGKDVILGKASRVTEDALLKHLQYEKQHFSIGNYLLTANEISHRLTRNLHKFIDSKKVNMIRVALWEIIVNAIEHGNLNISFEDKSAAIQNEDYLVFFAERQNNPIYRNRKVKIEYEVNREKAIYKIIDGGKGFDYKKILNNKTANTNLAHGRGITMATNIFDSIEYNITGNEVTLVKMFI